MSDQQNLPKLVHLSFFCAGAATFILQLAWLRAIQQHVGVALPTVAIVSATFMLGLLVGAMLVRRTAATHRQPLKLYSLSQIGLAAFGLLYSLLHQQLYGLLDRIATVNPDLWAEVEVVRIVLIAALLAVPTVCIGAAFPLIARSFFLMQNGGTKLVYAYGANSIGGCIGVVLCGFVFIPQLGLTGASVTGVLFAIAAAVTVKPGWKAIELGIEAPTATQASSPEPPFQFSSMVPVMVSGFVTLLLELLWTRFLFLIVGSSTHAFALMLANYLFATALASLLVSGLTKNQNKRITAPALISAGVYLLFTLYCFYLAPLSLIQLERFVLGLTGNVSLSYVVSRMILTTVLVFPPAFFLGIIFPACLKRVSDNDPQFETTCATKLWVGNVISATVAALMSGSILFPELAKLTSTPIIVSFGIVALALIAFGFADLNRYTPLNCGAALFPILILVLHPPTWPKSVMAIGAAYLPADQSSESLIEVALKYDALPNEELLYYREGLNSIVTIARNDFNNVLYLKTDGKMEAALPANLHYPSPTTDLATHVLLAYIPMALCRHDPQQAFLLGMGSGCTADALLDFPSLHGLTIVDLSKETSDSSRLFSSNFGNLQTALTGGRAKFVEADGRNYLSLLKRKYDVVISQPGEPFLNGMSDLYSQEFWGLARSRLTEGGVFAQWLQLYATDQQTLHNMIATFESVFPNSQIFWPEGSAELVIVGLNWSGGERGQIDSRWSSSRLENEKVRQRLAEISITDFPLPVKARVPSQFHSQLFTDDRLQPEFSMAPTLLLKGEPVQQKLIDLLSRAKRKTPMIPTNISNEKNAEFFQEAFKRDQFAFWACEGAGEAYAQLGQADRAELWFRKALSLTPALYQSRLDLGKLLCTSGREAEGLDQIAWASRLRPSDPEPNLFVTAYYAGKLKWHEAEENLARLETKLPNDPRVRALAKKISRRMN